MEKKSVSKILCILITFSVIITLFMSAPAEAFILGMNLPQEDIIKGNIVNFTISIKSEPNDREITFINFKMLGHKTFNCEFKQNGSVISGCRGIEIKKISSDSGYGYGDEEDFEYNITLDTEEYFPDTYQTYLIVNSLGGKQIKKKGSNLIIKSKKENPISNCSIRAKKGTATIDAMNFGDNNKMNFYVPLENARRGEGYITGQQGRTTFSYKFKIDSVLDNNANRTEIAVDGTYKVGIGNAVPEKSIIILDKVNNRIDVVGDSLNIVYMNVNFRDGCS